MSSDNQHASFGGAAVALAATAAYTLTPTLRFMHPDQLALAGFAIGVGAAGFWISIAYGWSNVWRYAYLFMGMVSLIWLNIQAIVAMDLAKFNDQRCLIIEADMLSAKPRRTDSASIYQALGCQPKGRTMLAFPAPVVPTPLVVLPAPSAVKITTKPIEGPSNVTAGEKANLGRLADKLDAQADASASRR